MKLTEIVPQLQIRPRMRATSMRAAFKELLKAAASIYTAMTDDELEELADRLEERERLASTVLEQGIAVPHVYYSRFRHLVGLFGRSERGIPTDGGNPVKGLFLLLVPEGRTDIQMMALNKVSTLVQFTDFAPRLEGCADEEDIYQLFADIDQTGTDGESNR